MNLEKTVKRLRLATLLSLLFCTILAWVINQQGQAIETQREMIRTLYQDTLELNRRRALEIKQQQEMRKKVPNAEQKHAESKEALPGCLPYATCG